MKHFTIESRIKFLKEKKKTDQDKKELKALIDTQNMMAEIKCLNQDNLKIKEKSGIIRRLCDLHGKKY